MRRPSRLLDQAELDRVPVHPRQLVEHAELLRAQAADAVGLDVVGDGRVHQQRHVAEHVVEDVRLLEVVELVRLADEVAGREAPVREVLEEHVVGHQARHGDDLPAGALHQDVGEAAEVRDLVRADRQVAHAVRRSRRRHGRAAAGSVARTASSRPRARPRCSCVPALVDGPVGSVGHRRVVGGMAVLGRLVELSQHQVFLSRRVVRHAGDLRAGEIDLHAPVRSLSSTGRRRRGWSA